MVKSVWSDVTNMQMYVRASIGHANIQGFTSIHKMTVVGAMYRDVYQHAWCHSARRQTFLKWYGCKLHVCDMS